jgi:hypothetical protein
MTRPGHGAALCAARYGQFFGRAAWTASRVKKEGGKEWTRARHRMLQSMRPLPPFFRWPLVTPF